MKNILLAVLFTAVGVTCIAQHSRCNPASIVETLSSSHLQRDFTLNPLVLGNTAWVYFVDDLDTSYFADQIGLWISALDQNDEILLSASSYGPSRGAFDFDAGTIDTSIPNELSDPAYCRLYKVRESDIDRHILDFSDGMIDNPSDAILLWPGRLNDSGMPGSEYRYAMAPFVDLNDNGIYNPMQGEYPDIQYNEALYWVVTDNRSENLDSGSDIPIQSDIHFLAQAPQDGDVNFIKATVLNRSDKVWYNPVISLFPRYNYDCSVLEMFGTSPQTETAFVSTYYVEGSSACPIENDSFNVYLTNAVTNVGMSASSGASVVFENGAHLPEIEAFRFPVVGVKSMFRNQQLLSTITGEPLTQGGIGYRGVEPTNWHFNGIDDWTMCSYAEEIGATPIFEGFLYSTIGTGEIPPGGWFSTEYALTTLRTDPRACPDRTLIDSVVQEAIDSYVQTSSSGKELAPEVDQIIAYPIPASQTLFLSLPEGEELMGYWLFSLQGEELMSNRTNVKEVSVKNLPAGLYFLDVHAFSGKRWVQKIVVSHE